MVSVAIFSPAKINLMLAVTGRRADGFHDLVSVAAPLRFGDTLWLSARAESDAITLECSDPTLPTGPDNLAWRAAQLFRETARLLCGIHIRLHKQIPVGAGLGGGSSNAVAVLRGLNVLFGTMLEPAALAGLAAQLGSDCSLFLANSACVLRGRGEQVDPLPAAARARLRDARLLLFKPDFPIATPWAYTRLASDPTHYTPARDAEHRLEEWLTGRLSTAGLLANSFEPVVGGKFIALPTLLRKIRRRPEVEGAILSGSGSACFALLNRNADAGELIAHVREAWGANAFVVETSITG